MNIYYKKNREQCIQRAMIWYLSNTEHCKERMKKYNKIYYQKKRNKTAYEQIIDNKKNKDVEIILYFE